MKFLVLVSIILFSITVIGYQHSFALQQVAGIIEVDISKGETKSAEWGLISDYSDKVTSIEIHAEGEGAEFLSFPKSIEIQPQQIEFVKITVNIPDDYSGNSVLSPVVIATEYGEAGGPTVINIQMKKTITLAISQPAPVPQVSTDTEVTTESEATPESEPTEAKENTEQPTTKIDESVCGEGTAFKDGKCVAIATPSPTTEQSKGGGCLIATAAFGSEIAPQVQMLREVRDNVLFSTSSGTAFMSAFNNMYYSFSPAVADLERDSPAFREIVKTAITPMLSTMSILNYVDTGSEQEMLGYGIGIILLNIGMYFAIPALVIIKLKNRLQKN